MKYYNIGQVVLGAPNDFLNKNLDPVKLTWQWNRMRKA
jgi:hypothetical protein